MERIEAIKDYYANLEYHQNSIEEALTKISDLAVKINFDYIDQTLDRWQAVASIIKENFLLFVPACRHVDVVTAILEYLTNFSMRIEQEMKCVEMYHTEKAGSLTMVTVANISNEAVVKSFLIHFLTKNTPIECIFQEPGQLEILGVSGSEYTCEMIILEDSDLYAVINCLMITKNFPLYKIWVQELVKEQFCWLIKKSCHSDLPIHTFQSLKDIEFYRCHNEDSRPTVNITSIWSEDIVTAKNLALSLNRHIVYINTYMDFNGGVVLLPYKKILYRKVKGAFDTRCDSDSDPKPSENAIYFSHTPTTEFSLIYNLFYDGMLQKPVKGMYWKYNDALGAIATNEDITRCYDSARKGFGVWSNKSIKSRIQILSKLQIIFQSAGKSLLAAIIAKWLKFPYIYKNLQGFYSQNDKVEVTYTRMPLSVIILKAEKENVLFFRLIQTLIAGNSVIVIFDADFCNLVPYCDMFSTCGLPPGVINFLSHDNVSVIERRFGIKDYTRYAECIFSTKGKSKETYIEPYKNLTIPKQIILPLK